MPTPTEMNSDIGSNTQRDVFTSKTTNLSVSNSSPQQKQIHQNCNKIDSLTSTSTNDENKGEKTNFQVSNNDMTSLNQTFGNILDTLGRYDKINIKHLPLFNTIQEKINTHHYSHPDEFKNDIDLLFTEVRSTSKMQQQNDIEQLYISVLASIQLEISRDHPSLMMDTSTLHPNDQDQIRTALFRPTLDGFIFTDANVSINQLSDHLPSKIQPIAVHPAPPESFTIPTLKQSIQSPYRFPQRYSKHEDKPIIPVQWLDYGAFTTFAPVCDSNNANASYESTYMGRAAKRHRRWERKQRRYLLQTGTNKVQQKQQHEEDGKQMVMDCDIDVDWLKDQGLNVDAILERVATKAAENDNEDDDDTTGLLFKNEKLIEKLLAHQENRFKLASVALDSDTYADRVDEEEHETANKLQQNLFQMLTQLSPSSVIHQKDIELAMSRLPLQETAYRGTLPSNKIFAFPTSEKIDASLPPPFANITPTYSKDRWRLIDAQGHDQPPLQAQPLQQQQQPTTLSSSSPSASPSSPLAVLSTSTSHKEHPPHTSSPLRS